MTMPSTLRPKKQQGSSVSQTKKADLPSTLKIKQEESFPKELSRSFVEHAIPSLSSPGAMQQRQKESEATPEELIDLVQSSDVIPG